MNVKVMGIIARLAAGEKVENREGGNSMLPLIKSKQPVTIEAVDTSKLERGDIVYVKVNGRVYTHRVLALRHGEAQIGNNKGGVNGWTKLDNVFGIITEIEGKPISGVREKVLEKQGVKSEERGAQQETTSSSFLAPRSSIKGGS